MPKTFQERIETDSEEGGAVTETFGCLQLLAAGDRLSRLQPTTAFDQWHLGRQVKTLQHFHGFTGATKADVLGAAFRCASHKPETVQVLDASSRISLAMQD